MIITGILRYAVFTVCLKMKCIVIKIPFRYKDSSSKLYFQMKCFLASSSTSLILSLGKGTFLIELFLHHIMLNCLVGV